MPNPSIKNEKLYRDLRDKGESKEKSARIANASAAEGQKKVASRGGKSPAYEDWTVDDLRSRAADLDIKGRSTMSKSDLIDALRNH